MSTSASFIVGAGCFWKTEAAYRFLHGVIRSEVGHIALSPEAGASPIITPVAESHRLWRVEVVAMEVDLTVLPLSRFMDVFWVTHTANELWNPEDTDFMSCRSLLVVPDADVRNQVKTLMEERAVHHAIKTRLYASAAYQRSIESDQDFCVRHPEDSYVTSQILPCLKKLWETMPEQMDLDQPT